MAVTMKTVLEKEVIKNKSSPSPACRGRGASKRITSDSEEEGWPPPPLQHPHKVTVHQRYKYTFKNITAINSS